MTKLTSILLLACLCFSLLGYHLIYHFQIAAAKSEMKAFLKSEARHKDVVELSFSAKEVKELEWENGHEFRYQNEMYDVIGQETKNGRLVIRCIPDKKETALLIQYRNTNKRRHSESLAVQLITIQFVLPADYSVDLPEKIIENYFCDHSFALHDPPAFIVIPPPKNC